MSKKKQPITLADRSFESKDDCADYFKELLHKYPVESILTGDDHILLNELIKRHPCALQKIGCGVKAFKIGSLVTARAFFVVRLDDSIEDFSYQKCITQPSKLSLFKKAARNTIARQVLDYKNMHYVPNMKCPLSGMVISSTKDAHIDHHPISFDQIITDFVQMNNLDIEKIPLSSRDQLQNVGDVIGDEQIADEFYKYHKQVAKFRLIHACINLTKKR